MPRSALIDTDSVGDLAKFFANTMVHERVSVEVADHAGELGRDTCPLAVRYLSRRERQRPATSIVDRLDEDTFQYCFYVASYVRISVPQSTPNSHQPQACRAFTVASHVVFATDFFWRQSIYLYVTKTRMTCSSPR